MIIMIKCMNASMESESQELSWGDYLIGLWSVHGFVYVLNWGKIPWYCVSVRSMADVLWV